MHLNLNYLCSNMKKMTRKVFSEEVVQRRLDLIQKVLQAKGTEYGADKSAFHNFDESTGISLHDKNTSAAWEMCVKHLTSIKDIITDYEKHNILPTIPLLEEKIGDAINYFILIEGMFKEQIMSKGGGITPETQIHPKVKYTLTDEKTS